MSNDDYRVRNRDLFRAVGWIVGGLSLLSLTKDFTALELYGVVRGGVEAYRALIVAVNGAMFGWIDWRWISISDFEAQLLVLSVVFASAAARATPYHDMAIGTSGHASSAYFVYFTVFVFPIFLSFLLLPGALALVPGLLWMLVMIYGLSVMKLGHCATGEKIPFAPMLAAEILGMVGILLAVLALNCAIAAFS